MKSALCNQPSCSIVSLKLTEGRLCCVCSGARGPQANWTAELLSEHAIFTSVASVICSLLLAGHCPYSTAKLLPFLPAGVKPVLIELTDFKTKKVVDVLEVDACMVATGRAPYTNGLNLAAINAETDKRGFVPVNDKMQVG